MISVIIPIYNAEHTLAQSVQSIKGENIEIILVDDASRDKSLKVCLDLAAHDKRIKVIPLEKNLGAGNARNEGLKAAQGEYAAFADADDCVIEGIFDEALEKIKSSDWVIWGVSEQYPKGGRRDIVPESAEAVFLEKQTLFGYVYNKLYRISIIREHNIQFEDTALYEDYFFNLKYVRCVNRTELIRQAGYIYRKGTEGSLTKRYVADYYQLSRQRIQSMYEYCRSWKNGEALLSEAARIMGNRYLRYILSALARGFDKRAGIGRSGRIRFIRNLYGDELYSLLSASCRTERKAYKILQYLINRRKTGLICLYGRFVYLIKRIDKAAGEITYES